MCSQTVKPRVFLLSSFSCCTVSSLLSCWKIAVSECCLLVLYFLLQYTTSHFAGVPVLAADVVSYAQGLKYALSKNVKLHFPPRTLRLYLFILTQPIHHIHQGVSKPSLRSFFAQCLEGEKCHVGAKFAIHKMVCLPDPCQLGRFPHFIKTEKKKKYGGKMLLVVSRITEALEHLSRKTFQ